MEPLVAVAAAERGRLALLEGSVPVEEEGRVAALAAGLGRGKADVEETVEQQ